MDTDTRNRLNAELCDLSQKIRKLERFIGTDKFKALGVFERSDLREQLHYMQDYHEVLSRRYSRVNGDALPCPRCGGEGVLLQQS